MTQQTTIFVDADACPVKDEVYKVAFRTKTPVVLVSNAYLRIPESPLVSQVVVSDGFDAADDHIAASAGSWDVVVTADILLAERTVKAGVSTLSPTGKVFDQGSIGSAVATRALMADLRAGGEQVGGPKPFSRTDRSRFLSALDLALTRLRSRAGA